jgi:hypothetical protein
MKHDKKTSNYRWSENKDMYVIVMKEKAGILLLFHSRYAETY